MTVALESGGKRWRKRYRRRRRRRSTEASAEATAVEWGSHGLRAHNRRVYGRDHMAHSHTYTYTTGSHSLLRSKQIVKLCFEFTDLPQYTESNTERQPTGFDNVLLVSCACRASFRFDINIHTYISYMRSNDLYTCCDTLSLSLSLSSITIMTDETNNYVTYISSPLVIFDARD